MDFGLTNTALCLLPLMPIFVTILLSLSSLLAQNRCTYFQYKNARIGYTKAFIPTLFLFFQLFYANERL